jgi:uncharacterized membrane protein
MDAKTKAILSHIFFIGWVIALVINMNQKEEYASYYIRQNLGLMIVGFVLSLLHVIPVLGWIIAWIGYILIFVFWLMSLIWSITDVMKPVPFLGDKFQEWFKSL